MYIANNGVHMNSGMSTRSCFKSYDVSVLVKSSPPPPPEGQEGIINL